MARSTATTRIRVYIVQARNLQAKDYTANAFCLVSLRSSLSGTSPRKPQSTQVIPGTVDPVWNESFDLVLESGSDTLEVKVMNKDSVGTESIGELVLPLGTVLGNDSWLPLQKTHQGEVRIAVGAVPPEDPPAQPSIPAYMLARGAASPTSYAPATTFNPPQPPAYSSAASDSYAAPATPDASAALAQQVASLQEQLARQRTEADNRMKEAEERVSHANNAAQQARQEAEGYKARIQALEQELQAAKSGAGDDMSRLADVAQREKEKVVELTNKVQALEARAVKAEHELANGSIAPPDGATTKSTDAELEDNRRWLDMLRSRQSQSAAQHALPPTQIPLAGNVIAPPTPTPVGGSADLLPSMML